jgi:hypothetical protein
MFDELVAKAHGAVSGAGVGAWARVEAAACARRLAAMVAMLDACQAADGSVEREQWYLDNWGAVCAEIGAAQQLTSGAASRLLLVGTALRDRLPMVGAVFVDGLVSYLLVKTIVWRTMLIKDPQALRAVDAALAEALRQWEPMSQNKTEQTIDALVRDFDPHAVRRTRDGARTRSVDVHSDGDGLASLWGTLFAHDATALDRRLDALAGTTCAADPRTRDQRRADALGALANGAGRLACLCGSPDCDAAEAPSPGSVVIHVVAQHDTIAGSGPAVDAAAQHAALDGRPPRQYTRPLRDLTLAEALCDDDPGEPSATPPAVMMGGSFLPGPIARRAALTASIKKVVHPGDSPPEPRYTPSPKLADFVRCRDLTCRFPGCDEPAERSDIDHTIPHPVGPTCASNLKCLCRFHHLLKTFWSGDGGWRDRQLPDGTVIWTSPGGQTHTTRPGSRLLFPSLCEPTAPVTATERSRAGSNSGLTMPRRRSTRSQDRQRRVDDERRRNMADAAQAALSAIPPF